MKAFIAVVVLVFWFDFDSSAGLLDSILGRSATAAAGAKPALATSLTEEQVISGLKEALGKGLQQAVTQLGREGGFLTNLNVRIPMPDKLRTVERTLRALKQDKLADDFVEAMNHAAEQAVPAAASVFSGAITNLSVADAKAILTGPEDAATQYFRRATETNLFVKFLPIVKEYTDKTGVTSSYKRLVERANSSSLGSLAGSFLNVESVDVDTYVTQKSMDGLFKMVAAEEKRIRENPVARTSELLQKVFGAVVRQ